MENKHFKVGEKVYIFDNRLEEPRIIEGTIIGAMKTEGIYDYIYWIDSPYSEYGEKCQRYPYHIYRSLEELKEDVLNYVVSPDIHK